MHRQMVCLAAVLYLCHLQCRLPELIADCLSRLLLPTMAAALVSDTETQLVTVLSHSSRHCGVR